MRLSMKLPLLLVAGIGVATAAGGWLAIDASSGSLRRATLAAASDSAAGYAATVESRLDAAVALLEVSADEAATSGLVASAGVEAARTMAAAVEQTHLFGYLTLLRPDGSVALVAPDGLQVGPAPADLAYTAWFRQVRQTGRAVVSDLHVSAITQAPVVVVAVPVQDPVQGLVGVLAGALRQNAFARLGESGGPPGIGYGLVTDGRGLVIAHEAEPSYVTFQTDLSSVPAVRSALDGASGAGSWLDPLDGERKLGAYRPLGPSGWAIVYTAPEALALAPVHDLTDRLIATSAALLVVLAGLGVTAARRLTQPLRELEVATQDVAAGNLGAHVPQDRHDEVGQLAACFNDMVASLARADLDLRRNTTRLEAVNAELEAFAYSVSHDLRAPLRAIDGFSQVLLEDLGPRLDGEALDHLARVRGAAQRMGVLIDDLLRLSRLGRAEMHLKAVDLTGVARGVARELADREPERDVTWVIDPGVVVAADEPLLRVLLENLLQNAWKYTSRLPTARIEVGLVAPGVVFVRDDGVGFDMVYADRLFGAFQRLHRQSEFPGTGIGLATVRRIVTRHGGWIHAHSRPDAGAVFWFTLDDTAPDIPTPPLRSEQGGSPVTGGHVTAARGLQPSP